MSCAHKVGFDINVKVNVFEDMADKMQLELELVCQECKAPFVFLGLPVGLSLVGGAYVNVDGTELRCAVALPGSPGPLAEAFKEMRGPAN